MSSVWSVLIGLGVLAYLGVGLVVMVRVQRDLNNPYSVWRPTFIVIAWPRIGKHWYDKSKAGPQ